MFIEPIIWGGEISRKRHELFGFIKRVLWSYFKIFKEVLFHGVS